MNISEAREVLARVSHPEYTLSAIVDGRGEMYLQASYMEADIFTHRMEVQLTRRWFISPEMSNSELVQTAFKCIMTSAEHRVREHFRYRGELIFGPHFDVENLHWLAKCDRRAFREGPV